MTERELLSEHDERALMRAANQAGVATLAPEAILYQSLGGQAGESRRSAAGQARAKLATWMNEHPLTALAVGVGVLYLLGRRR
jgi:hypothetical protein